MVNIPIKEVAENLNDFIQRTGRKHSWVAERTRMTIETFESLLSGEVFEEELINKVAILFRKKSWEFFLPKNYVSPPTLGELIESANKNFERRLAVYEEEKKNKTKYYEDLGLEKILELYIDDPIILDLVKKEISTQISQTAQTTQLKKWGNSQGIRIPKEILSNVELTENDTLSISTDREKQQIILTKVSK